MTLTFALYFLKVIDKDFKPGLRLLHELYVSIREAEKLAADDEVLGAEVDYLERDYVTYLSLAESLQALHVGEAALTAMLNDEENLKMDVVFFALDKFKEAEVLSKGEAEAFGDLLNKMLASIETTDAQRCTLCRLCDGALFHRSHKDFNCSKR